MHSEREKDGDEDSVANTEANLSALSVPLPSNYDETPDTTKETVQNLFYTRLRAPCERE